MSTHNSETEKWDRIIRSQSPLFDLRLNELWNYRELIFLFTRRDFLVKYRQTILGPLWHVLQPFIMTVVFTLVFTDIAKISTDGLPPFLFYMSGVVVWSFFSGTLNSSASVLTANAYIFGKIYFPRLVIPISNAMSRLIAFAIQFFFLICFLIFFITTGTDVNPSSGMLLIPVILFFITLMAIGTGLIISALTIRYRDLAVMIGFGIQLWMFATPIVYPVSAMPEHLAKWIWLNPIAPLVEAFRLVLLGQGTFDPSMLVISVCIISVTLVIGIILFNRAERNFIDTI